jgi:hypothetical protein
MLILRRTPQAVQEVVQGIASLWEIRDLGDVSLILGLRVRRNRQNRTLLLNQSEYIQGLIKRFRLRDCAPVNLPVSDRNTLIKGLPSEALAD